MSADNWAICPRCVKQATDRAEQKRADVMALYGSIPVEEFDAKRAALEDVNPLDDFATFREDYEFYGAIDGEIIASYSGSCSVCELSCEFEHVERFWPTDAPGAE